MVRLGLVVATFHGPIVEAMAESARTTAAEADAEVVATIEVPGAYDAVLPADRLARRDDVDAVAVLGAIVTGETDHDQVIGHALANQLQAVARERDTPVTLGVAGPGMTADAATDRTDYGARAVDAAIELVEALAAHP
ncbi:MAG: 6,7-dimethyl-8-ribityllumazine synthase [Halobacteriales archaeon]